MSEGRLQVKHLSLFFREAGAGQPIVLLHCAGGTSGQWRKLMEKMSGRYRLLAVDLPSHGKSDPVPPDIEDEFELEVEAIAVCASYLGPPIHIVGHSSGASSAARFATRHPELVRSLVLFEPTLFPVLANGTDEDGWNDYLRLVTGMSDQISAGNKQGAAEVLVDYWARPGMYRSLPIEQQRSVVRGVDVALKKAQRAVDDPAATTINPADIKVPTILLSGTKSPRSARGVIDVLATGIKGAQLHKIDGAGHMAPLTHAGVVNSMIERYIIAHSD